MSVYIKKFSGHTDYSSFIQTDDFVKPNVSLCVQENDVHYNKQVVESLSSIVSVGDNPNHVEWTPTNDEIEYDDGRQVSMLELEQKEEPNEVKDERPFEQPTETNLPF